MNHYVTYRTLTVYGQPSHAVQLKCFNQISWSYNPATAVTAAVWAPPRSLATTRGIILIFCSSGYLDVSVLRVCRA